VAIEEVHEGLELDGLEIADGYSFLLGEVWE
jgi:hypothetical protein